MAKKQCQFVEYKNEPPTQTTTSTTTSNSAPDTATKTESTLTSTSPPPNANDSTENDNNNNTQEPAGERCTRASNPLMGQCGQCEKYFCQKHRLPEDHACTGAAKFQSASKAQLREQLFKNATLSNTHNFSAQG